MFLSNVTSENIKSFGTSALEATLGWAGASLFILTTLEYIVQLSGKEHYENSGSIRWTVLSFIGLLSLIDCYVHFKVFNHKRYDKKQTIEGGHSRQDAVKPKENSSLLHPHHHNHFSIPAFICAFSCSIELVGVPSATAELMRGMRVISGLDRTQKIVELSFSTLTLGFCIWAGSRRYALAKNHLENGHQHNCC